MAFSSAGSIFGGGSGSGMGTNTTGPQPTSIFGNSSGTAQPAQNSSLFGSQAQTQNNAGQNSIIGQQAGSSQIKPIGQATQPAFFNSLLERGRKRPILGSNEKSNFEELPSLQLGLDDIRRKARELGAGGTKDRDILNNKA